MKMTIIGKTPVTVSKKTNKPGFWLICTYKRVGIEGVDCDKLYLNPSEDVPFDLFEIGHEVNVDRDGLGRLVNIDIL